MKGLGKKLGFLGIIAAIAPSIYGDTYSAAYAPLFLYNKTDQDVVVRFFTEYYEQQQYPLKAKEHRMIRLKEGVMRKLFMVKVTMQDPRTGKMIMKEIDYKDNTNIESLKISMKQDLDLKWGYAGDNNHDNDSY